MLGRIVQAPTISSLPDILCYNQQAVISANMNSALKLSAFSEIEKSLGFRQKPQLELTSPSLLNSSMMLPSTISTDELTAYGYRSAQSESTILTDLNGNDVIGSVGMLENIIKNL